MRNLLGFSGTDMPVEISKRRFDVDEYHRMAEAGILSHDDRVELIDGEIVAMTPIGPRHNAAVDRINRALVRTVGDRAIVRVQGFVRLGRFFEPQPDFAVLRPRPDFYASHLPGAADILLIVEVADASLDYDRDLKTRLYAGAGVAEYWIVDLNGRSVACYSEPAGGAYTHVGHHGPEGTIAPQLLLECRIETALLLLE